MSKFHGGVLMGLTPVPRKNKVEFMLSDDELKIVKRRAEKEGLTVSEWVRMACMVTSAFDGDTDAWRLTFKNASEKAKEMVGRLFSELGVRKFHKRG